jgi:hypothetical protein
MARAKVYETNAERQAAYRSRKRRVQATRNADRYLIEVMARSAGDIEIARNIFNAQMKTERQRFDCAYAFNLLDQVLGTIKASMR